MARYKLGDICEIVSGSTPKTGTEEFWDGNIKWITPAEINEDTYIINDSVRKITELAVKKTGLSPFPEGTVILSSRAPIGKVAIAGCEMYCNQGFKNLICSDVIYNKYLYWFLKGKTKYLNSLGRGATFKELSKTIVSEIPIDVPSIDEQIRIVEIFEKINEIIIVRKHELEELDKLIKARFVEMFDSDIRKSNMTISDVAEETTVGIANSATHAYSDSGVVMLRNQNIRVNYLDESDLIFIKKEFVREIVGLDMNAAKEAFSEYLSDTNMDSRQIYFVNQIVEYIVHNGMMKDLSVLQESPFTDRGSVVEIFTDLSVWMGIRNVIDRINANAAA